MMVKSNEDSDYQNVNMNSNTAPNPAQSVQNSPLWMAAQLSHVNRPSVQAQQLKNGENGHPWLSEDVCGPPGLSALCEACSRLYSNQPNPLQVTARVKYWLGGPDPLDYISMYWNQGNRSLGIPPHWHYISFGLSDLHGDGRVHPLPDRVILSAMAEAPHLNLEVHSGFGLEMTFRLLAEPGIAPPMWPAALLQALARYVFKTGNRLCVGDHISWHSAIDGSGDGRSKGSRLRHMLVAVDPQLGEVQTPLGSVQFVQIVGATARELRAAQAGRGQDVLDIMAADAGCGGKWHVTDMTRLRSARGLSSRNIRPTPSDLAGVSAVVSWSQWVDSENQASTPELPQTVKEQIKNVLQKGLTEINAPFSETPLLNPTTINAPNFIDCKMSTDSLKIERTCTGLSTDSLKAIFSGNNMGGAAMSTDSFEMSKIEDALLAEVLQSDNDPKSVKIEDAFADFVKTETEWENNACEGNFCQDHCPGFNPGSNAVHTCKDCQVTGEEPSKESWCPEMDAEKAVPLKGVHLVFNAESGSLLPLALRGRVSYGRHFTWRSASGDQAVTILSSSVSGAFVSEQMPYAANRHGWLQILLPQDFALEMSETLHALSLVGNNDSEGEGSSSTDCPPILPAIYAWPSRNLKITVTNDDPTIVL